MVKFIVHNVKLYVSQIYYWLIVSLFLVMSLSFYSLYYVDSVTSSYFGAIAPPPNYMIVMLGGFPLLLMACFLGFMGRNILTRDQYYRIHDVVITRPLSNFRMITAKLAALVLVGWLPIVLYIGLIQVGAYLHNFLDIDFAVPFQFTATLKFLLLTCPVTLAFVATLAVLFNQIFRNNMLTLVALFTTVLLGSFLLTKVPYSQYFAFEGLPLIGNIGSELDPERIAFSDLIRYLGFVTTIVFLCYFGIVCFHRNDIFVSRNVFGGVVAGVCLVLCLGFSVTTGVARSGKLAFWLDEFNDNTAAIVPQVDVQKMSASVQLDPARELSIRTELALRVLANPIEGTLILWLNPGFVIEEVMLDGHAVNFELDAQGALRIELNEILDAEQAVSVMLAYAGKPDLDYGYFDSSSDASKLPMWDQLISYLGDANGIFNSRFVALPSELNWLPATFRPLHQLRTHKDFFLSSITLTLPFQWEAAVPGRKLTNEPKTTQTSLKTLEFVTESPVSSVGLYAGPLVSVTRNIRGVVFEILMSEKQLNSLGVLRESIDSVADTFAEHLDANLSDGFQLPCTDYRFVVVPQRLRSYGGGTFMSSILSSKCSYLLREFDVFAVDWDGAIPPYIEQIGMDREDFIVQVLKNYFRFGFGGTNFELDLFNSYWDHEIGIAGLEAETLSLILAYLNDLVWYRSMDGFSASGYFPKTMGRAAAGPQQIGVLYGGQVHMGLARHHLNRVVKPMIRHVDLVESVIMNRLHTEELQRVAQDHSIQQLMESELNPFLVESLRMKCAHLSFQLYQILEEEGARMLLDELLARYRHSNFSLADLYATSSDMGLPVEEVLGNWFGGTEQPYYTFSGAKTYRKKIPEEAEEEFQTLFHVRNQGEGVGVFRTSVTTEMRGLSAWGAQVGADFAVATPNPRYGASSVGPVVYLKPGQTVEIGIVSELEPLRVLLQPLNITLGGGRVAIPTKTIEDVGTIDSSTLEEFHGFRPSDWVPPLVETGIVVDDLDLLVTVEDNKQVSEVKTWRRVDYPSAWGSLRRTMVYCESQNPKSITFATELPIAARWQLEFHVPDFRGQYGDYQQGILPRGRIGTGFNVFLFWQSIAGEYTFTLESETFSQDVAVSISDNDYGWIHVAEAALERGAASVTVQPRNTREKLFGDAIRWVQVEDGE